MTSKIFKPILLTTIAVMVLSAGAFAQKKKAHPAKHKAPKTEQKDKDFDEDDFDQKMEKLNIGLDSLGEQINSQVNVSVNLLGRTLTTTLQGLGPTISKAVSGATSNLSVDLSGIKMSGGNSVIIGDDDDDDDNDGDEVRSGDFIEKTKTYSKVYTVDDADVLQINNTFGKVVVNTWNRREFKVDVQMILGAKDEDYVNDMLNNINVTDSKAGQVVAFKTNIRNTNRRNNGNSIKINYTVYMPAGNALDIKNQFGDVILPDLNGKTTLRLSYGTLKAQQLLNTANDVKLSFSEGTIENFNGGRLAASYGKITAGTVNNVVADFSFAGLNAGRLKNDAKINLSYGDGFNIGTIDKSVRNISINASYTKINLDFNEASSFNYDVTTKYGDFDYNEDVVKTTYKSSDEVKGWSSTKTYKGYIGKKDSDGKISINAEFTKIDFN